MSERFTPLAQWFEGTEPSSPLPADTDEPLADVVEIAAVSEPQAGSDADEADGRDDAIGDVRRFRAALADALDVALHDLVREIAVEVVARELRLAPADIRAVVDRARERYAFDDPLAIRVHPDDCAALRDVAVVAPDAALRRGDVVIELASGTIEATLGARLERVIAARVQR